MPAGPPVKAEERHLAAAFAELPEQGGILHATTVCVPGRALLICGPAGGGKSAMALAMMALGAALIADDRTLVRPAPTAPMAEAPPGLPSAIEARGLGLLRARLAPPAPVTAVLDLTRTETDRLPPLRSVRLLGHNVTLLHNVGTPHFPAALLQYLCQGFAPL